MTVEQLDQKFGALRDAIVPLVKKLKLRQINQILRFYRKASRSTNKKS